jgi:hypothetical protein
MSDYNHLQNNDDRRSMVSARPQGGSLSIGSALVCFSGIRILNTPSRGEDPVDAYQLRTPCQARAESTPYHSNVSLTRGPQPIQVDMPRRTKASLDVFETHNITDLFRSLMML